MILPLSLGIWLHSTPRWMTALSFIVVPPETILGRDQHTWHILKQMTHIKLSHRKISHYQKGILNKTLLTKSTSSCQNMSTCLMIWIVLIVAHYTYLHFRPERECILEGPFTWGIKYDFWNVPQYQMWQLTDVDTYFIFLILNSREYYPGALIQK